MLLTLFVTGIIGSVDGGWGAWSGWSECSAECGGGTQTKSKQCNNPAPANGGADCQGESTKTRECNTQACEGKIETQQLTS